MVIKLIANLLEGNFTPVDFKSAAARPDPANAAFDHEIQLVSYQLLLILILCLLPGLWSCGGGGDTSDEEARVKREVERRVEVIRGEMKVAENRWHSVRVVAFTLLAGGSLVWLFHEGGAGGPPSLSGGQLPEPRTPRRVIDRPPPRHEPDER